MMVALIPDVAGERRTLGDVPIVEVEETGWGERRIWPSCKSRC